MTATIWLIGSLIWMVAACSSAYVDLTSEERTLSTATLCKLILMIVSLLAANTI